MITCSSAVPASAEVGITASLFSDARFRGYSLSDGRPVAMLDFAYDDPSGFYADALGTVVLERSGGAAPLSLQLTGGYARRLESGTTVDFGVTQAGYSQYSRGRSGSSYAELYAGLARGRLSSRVFFSPHYGESGLWTAYGEVNGSISPAAKWSIDGHAGMLVPLRTPVTAERYRTAFDWRVGVTRELGRISLRAAWIEGARGRPYYNTSHSSRALVVGATWRL